MANFLQHFDKSTVGRAVLFFTLIVVIFFCIEIAPLHFGNRHLPWDALGPEISKRLPRILLVAIGASLLMAFKQKDKVEK